MKHKGNHRRHVICASVWELTPEDKEKKWNLHHKHANFSISVSNVSNNKANIFFNKKTDSLCSPFFQLPFCSISHKNMWYEVCWGFSSPSVLFSHVVLSLAGCWDDYTELGGSCYKWVNLRVQWYAAQRRCAAEGAHLATFADDTEINLMQSLSGYGNHNVLCMSPFRKFFGLCLCTLQYAIQFLKLTDQKKSLRFS